MNLHQQFVSTYDDIKKMKNKLISLLLEIYKQGIYKNHGCETIYEYGFRFAYLSKDVVNKAIRTAKHLEDKPLLFAKIESEGIHKVALVATIATRETDEEFAEHVGNMSKAALTEFAKEVRGNTAEKPCKAVSPGLKIQMDEETEILFLKLKKKYAQNKSNLQALKLLLKKLEEPKNPIPGNGITHKQQAKSRHINKQHKEKILQKYNHRCVYPKCRKPYDHLHHRIPFATHKSHETIIPLCKTHHELAHNGLIKNQLQDPENWQLSLTPQKSPIDQKYLEKRKLNHAGKV